MSPEAEVAFEQELGVDPNDVELGDQRIRGDAQYERNLQAGAKAYWLLIEARVLDQRSVLTFWQLSAFEQAPYIKLAQLWEREAEPLLRSARDSAVEDARMEFVASEGFDWYDMRDAYRSAQDELHMQKARRVHAETRVAELEVQLGLRAGDQSLNELERVADEA